MKKEVIVLLISVCAVLSIGLYGLSNNRDIPKNMTLFTIPKTQDYIDVAVWEWHFPQPTATEDLKLRFEQLSKAGVKTIYLNLNDLIDIAELPNTAEKNQKKAEFYMLVKDYVFAANASGIAVHGLFGEKTWTSSSHRYLNEIAIDLVSDYNQQVPLESKLTGIHFDHEPFSLPEFQTNQHRILTEYLDTFEIITTKMNRVFGTRTPNNFILGVDVPYWLDGENGNILPITRGRVTLFPIFHLLHILNEYENSEVVFMAYRNTAEGKNGTLELVSNEFQYAQENSLAVGLLVGQELNDEEPKNITFYGKNLEYLLTNLFLIDTHLQNVPNYKGIALHELSSYEEMLQEKN